MEIVFDLKSNHHNYPIMQVSAGNWDSDELYNEWGELIPFHLKIFEKYRDFFEENFIYVKDFDKTLSRDELKMKYAEKLTYLFFRKYNEEREPWSKLEQDTIYKVLEIADYTKKLDAIIDSTDDSYIYKNTLTAIRKCLIKEINYFYDIVSLYSRFSMLQNT